MIVAKPVVNGKYWILKDGEVKVGEIQKQASGVRVKVNSQATTFKTLSLAAQRLALQIDRTPLPSPTQTFDTLQGYPTVGEVYNPVYDIQRRIPLYTKEARSRSQFAAGWYRVQQGSEFEWMLCPKLILLQRYPWSGPFKEPT